MLKYCLVAEKSREKGRGKRGGKTMLEILCYMLFLFSPVAEMP